MQTILGAGGAIGNQLARELTHYTDKIRLVSRNPRAVTGEEELFSANLMDYEEVSQALRGTEIAYLTAGVPYSTKAWQDQWPEIMNNVVNACQENSCKLVFFDNIYMYDPDYLDGMDESTPLNPCSKKGEVRARIYWMLMDEVSKGTLNALVARSADFYGPSVPNSVLTETVLKHLAKGKTALWMGKSSCQHAFTYTPDACKATAMLGNDPEAYNQVWHLPTASVPPEGKEWVEMAAHIMGVKPRYRKISGSMIKFLGLFNPLMRELGEMVYQYERDYVFNSSKFEKRYNYEPVSYRQGLTETIQQDYPELVKTKKQPTPTPVSQV